MFSALVVLVLVFLNLMVEGCIDSQAFHDRKHHNLDSAVVDIRSVGILTVKVRKTDSHALLVVVQL